MVQYIDVGPPLGSHHANATFILVRSLDFNTHEASWVRDFKAGIYDRIKKHLAAIDWIGILENVETVDEIYETLLFVLHHVIDLYDPMKKIELRSKRLQDHLRRTIGRQNAL